MQRDLNLIRAILLEVERRPETDALRPIAIEGYDDATVEYHMLLAIDSGLIEADEHQSNGKITFQPSELTTEGQSFLNLARNEETWNRTLQHCELCIRTIPFGLFHMMLAHEAALAIET